MSNLFDPDGHLTDFALTSLTGGAELNDLERLEISEHLSFCDTCLTKYTEMLDGTLLLAPPEPAAPTVIQRIRLRTRKLFISKYATVTAAASFAILFWNIGVFDVDIANGNGRILEALTNSAYSIGEKTIEFSNDISNKIDRIIDHLKFERSPSTNEKK